MRQLKKQIDPELFKQKVLLHKGHLNSLAAEFNVSKSLIQTLINIHFKYSEIEQIRNSRVDRMR